MKRTNSSEVQLSIVGRTLVLGAAIVCAGCIEGRKEVTDGGGHVDALLDTIDQGLPPGDLVSAQSDGQVSCVDNGACGAMHYCERSMGCLGSGICVLRPTECAAIQAPVCGCDGLTYGNGCLAALAGVNVMDQGGCATGMSTCYDSAECVPGEFCNVDHDCGASAGPGACELKPGPLDCTMTAEPVCGCDNADYTSACEAHVLGVSVLADQECAP